MMRASELEIGQRFIAYGKEYVASAVDSTGCLVAVDIKSYTVKTFPATLFVILSGEPELPLPPLPDGYELAPNDHVLDGDSYRIDGCDRVPREWLPTIDEGLTVKRFKEAYPNLSILAVARRKKPKYRPYNTDEMRALVGKVLVCPDGDHHLVTDWDAEGNSVCMADSWYYADDLYEECKTLDGQPCRVAE